MKGIIVILVIISIVLCYIYITSQKKKSKIKEYYTHYNYKKYLKGKKNERYYQAIMCQQLKGKMEYILPDKARVDCLTNNYAIEVDWAKKWAEGIGQALYYAKITGKKPAVGLIISRKKKDKRFLKRLQVVADEFNIKIIKIKKEVN